MTLETITQFIEKARQQEAGNGHFRRTMAERLEELHGIVRVDGDQHVENLLQFGIEYIETAPQLIECVSICARNAGVEELFKPFIEAAIGYFTNPSILLSHYDGLDGLLIKAYLCHRLMEEMYENNRSFRNSNLVDMDATLANLLAHHLIGEPFANELDQSILITVRQIAGTPDYYDLNLSPFVEQASDSAWDWMRDHWMNLLASNGIRFHFAHRAGL